MGSNRFTTPLTVTRVPLTVTVPPTRCPCASTAAGGAAGVYIGQIFILFVAYLSISGSAAMTAHTRIRRFMLGLSSVDLLSIPAVPRRRGIYRKDAMRWAPKPTGRACRKVGRTDLSHKRIPFASFPRRASNVPTCTATWSASGVRLWSLTSPPNAATFA